MRRVECERECDGGIGGHPARWYSLNAGQTCAHLSCSARSSLPNLARMLRTAETGACLPRSVCSVSTGRTSAMELSLLDNERDYVSFDFSAFMAESFVAQCHYQLVGLQRTQK